MIAYPLSEIINASKKMILGTDCDDNADNHFIVQKKKKKIL